jgi:ribosomal protein S12 methylthiotransferase accessory factor
MRAAAGHSPFPPPVSPDHAAAHCLGRDLAVEADTYFTAPERMRVREAIQYQWGPQQVGTHPLLRYPGCSLCGHREPRMPFTSPVALDLKDQPTAEPLHILKLVSRLVDPVTGPITSLQRFIPGPDDPKLHHWVTVLADPAWESFGRNTLQCGGNALSSDVAQAAALGEAVERSSTCHASFSDLLVARHEDIAAEALDPLAWDLFDARTRGRSDFPFVPPSRDTEMSWVWGYSLTRACPVRVPASRVFSPYRAIAPGDAFDGPIISGYSTGVTLEDAIYGALMEVLERDAFMIAWANQLEGLRLLLDGSSRDEVGAYLSAIESCGVEVRCVLVHLGLGAHTVIALARDTRPGEPASVVSAATDVDAAAACRRALKELTANRLNVRHEMGLGAVLPDANPETVRDEASHGLLFARMDMVPQLDVWWGSPEKVALPAAPPQSSPAARVQSCVQAISRAGLEVTVVDLTAPAMGALGLRTVKVLVPGTYPMSFDGRFPHFGGRRMLEAPVTAGLRKTPLTVEQLCRIPHPFP